MSHGHDHKKYKAVFGDVERGSRGLTVLCDGEAPKTGTETKQTSRTICLADPLPACSSCEHNNFALRFRAGVGDQIVACPTWGSPGDRLDRRLPLYQMVRRQDCLLRRPYEHCSFCPNRNVHNKPEQEPGWWERRFWKEE